MTALRLHGVTIADANHHPVAGEGGQPGNGPSGPVAVSLIPFRDLCAVVSEQRAFALDDSSQDSIVAHRAVIDSIFRSAPVLPAPVGVVFRTPDVIKRWMELHYVSLSDALAFVEDRAVARVHILRGDGKADELESGSDLAAAAAESLRALRRKAAASVPLRLEQVTGLALSAAFLIERDLWRDFQLAVDEQRDAHQRLQFDVTGPWAPYDFVRMQFGG